MDSARRKKYRRVVVWMRRAWRIHDNAPLWNAVRDADEVIPVVCLGDQRRYQELTPRRKFIQSSLEDLDAHCRSLGSRLTVRLGPAEEQIPAVAASHDADAVYAVEAYDPATRKRDARIARALTESGRSWATFKDAVVFDGGELVAASGNPYRVFTPYKKAWLSRLEDAPRVLPRLRSLSTPAPGKGDATLDRVPGFSGNAAEGGETAALRRMKHFLASGIGSYKETRDIPGMDGTSRLSAHLSLGTISIRTILAKVLETREGAGKNERENIDVYLSELIWREFYYSVLFHFPHVTGGAFRSELNSLVWSENRSHFAAWCEGRTGYPIVDAGMRQLQQEGWMHNRVRMIVASFLTKDLHLNWQWGERFFLERLIDADIASNNGGWQWTAGTGTDASPWFRIFNPVAQGERFDPKGEYVRRYLPELAGLADRYIHRPWEMSADGTRGAGKAAVAMYPAPIVRHDEERRLTLQLYKHPGTRPATQMQHNEVHV
jgi:deoxyribodipyrimidine photo-lyase